MCRNPCYEGYPFFTLAKILQVSGSCSGDLDLRSRQVRHKIHGGVFKERFEGSKVVCIGSGGKMRLRYLNVRYGAFYGFGLNLTCF